MPTKKEAIADLDWITDRLSTQIRAVALGTLALAWGLIVGDVDGVTGSTRVGLAWVALLAVVVMLTDYLQYLFAYLSTRSLLARMTAESIESRGFDMDWRYNFRRYLFWTKQVLLFVDTIWLGAILAGAFLI